MVQKSESSVFPCCWYSGVVCYPQTLTVSWILKTFNFAHFTARLSHPRLPGANSTQVHYGNWKHQVLTVASGKTRNLMSVFPLEYQRLWISYNAYLRYIPSLVYGFQVQKWRGLECRVQISLMFSWGAHSGSPEVRKAKEAVCSTVVLKSEFEHW